MVSAAQLAQIVFVAGGGGASEDLWGQAFNGHAGSNWGEFMSTSSTTHRC